MSERDNRTKMILMFLSVGFAALFLQARVFQSQGMAGGDLSNPGSFGAQLYKAIMQINGERAEVSVVACEGGVGPVRQAFSAAGQTGARFHAGESLGMGSASLAGNRIRVVTLASDPEARLLMVAVSQPERTISASPAAGVRHSLDDVPVPSDARILSTLRNADTRTTLERVSSRMPREGVSAYYEMAMARSGWSRATRMAARPGLSVYVKGADLCCVRIGDVDSAGECPVTLLHKAGAVK